MMLYGEWSKLSDDGKRALFQAYEDHRIAAEDRFPPQEGYAQMSDLLAEALAKFTELTIFVHVLWALFRKSGITRCSSNDCALTRTTTDMLARFQPVPTQKMPKRYTYHMRFKL